MSKEDNLADIQKLISKVRKIRQTDMVIERSTTQISQKYLDAIEALKWGIENNVISDKDDLLKAEGILKNYNYYGELNRRGLGIIQTTFERKYQLMTKWRENNDR